MSDAAKPQVFGTELHQTPNHPEPSIGIRAAARVIPKTLDVRWGAHTAPKQNYCAQAAIVTLMAAFNALGGRSPEQVFTELMRSHPPDLLWGHLGTHPDQLVRGIRAQGLQCYFTSVSNWYLGGFSNPMMNDQFWRPHRTHFLDLINRGFPAICLVDGGMMTGGAGYPFTLHYVVAHSYDGHSIGLCNDLVNGIYSDNRMPFDKFALAWECRTLPTGAPKFFAAFGYP